MDFNSHMSGVVTTAVALINALTPGWSRGRPFNPDIEHRTTAAEHALNTGLHPSDEHLTPRQADELAEHATQLRRIFTHLDNNDLDAACAHANTMLRHTGAVPTLSHHDGEPWHLHFHAPDAPLTQGWAAAMSTGLAVVLGNTGADRLGACSAPSCDRVYVDTSRNGTRRFCSTSCQNRVKANAFRHRHT